ncbi:MAG TPA: hypothetical protein VFS21_26725 [Roseiflexaceae bacterium]|nr:hypothetical protein [Roseiflexaceae bacterium]
MDEQAELPAGLGALHYELAALRQRVQGLWHNVPPAPLCRQIAAELSELAQQLQRLADRQMLHASLPPGLTVQAHLDRRRRRDRLRLSFDQALWRQIGRPLRLDVQLADGTLLLIPLWTAQNVQIHGYPVEAGRSGQWQIYCPEERAGGLTTGSYPATVRKGAIALILPSHTLLPEQR